MKTHKLFVMKYFKHVYRIYIKFNSLQKILKKCKLNNNINNNGEEEMLAAFLFSFTFFIYNFFFISGKGKTEHPQTPLTSKGTRTLTISQDSVVPTI